MQLYIYSDLSGDVVRLNAEESHHLAKVMRLKRDDIIYITDGAGTLAEAKVIDPDPKGCEAVITKRIHDYGKRKYRLHIAVAPTKNIDRFEWFLEKATEIGIDRVTPLLTARSERKVINTARLEKVIAAACKQSIKTYFPALDELTSYSTFLENLNETGSRFIAHCRDSNLALLKSKYVPGNDAVILIGPEGDFTDDEIGKAEKKACTAISLGQMRLRTETAALVACHSIAFMNQ